jgi:hypothetical protein
MIYLLIGIVFLISNEFFLTVPFYSKIYRLRGMSKDSLDRFERNANAMVNQKRAALQGNGDKAVAFVAPLIWVTSSVAFWPIYACIVLAGLTVALFGPLPEY